MKKIGNGTVRPISQIIKERLVIKDIESKTQGEVAELVQTRINNFERTHDGYKFDKLIFDFTDPEQFDLKFILK